MNKTSCEHKLAIKAQDNKVIERGNASKQGLYQLFISDSCKNKQTEPKKGRY